MVVFEQKEVKNHTVRLRELNQDTGVEYVSEGCFFPANLLDIRGIVNHPFAKPGIVFAVVSGSIYQKATVTHSSDTMGNKFVAGVHLHDKAIDRDLFHVVVESKGYNMERIYIPAWSPLFPMVHVVFDGDRARYGCVVESLITETFVEMRKNEQD